MRYERFVSDLEFDLLMLERQMGAAYERVSELHRPVIAQLRDRTAPATSITAEKFLRLRLAVNSEMVKAGLPPREVVVDAELLEAMS
jgi:hypothetical protein